MASIRRIAFALVLAAAAPAASAQEGTERYAPAQLNVARDFLAQARAAALRGDAKLAGKLAWQATLDARLTWGMTESPWLRAEAAEVGAEASVLVTRLAARP